MRYSKTIVYLLIAMALSCASSAQFLGQMTSANVLPRGTGNAGGYVGFYEHYTAVVGSVRYGLGPYLDGRLRMGLIDPENGDMGFIMGGDILYQLWKLRENNNPFDLGITGAMEFATMDPIDFFSVGSNVVISYPFLLKNQRSIEPYGRVGIRIQHSSYDGGRFNSTSNTDLEAGIGFGALFRVTSLVDFTAEIQIDDESAFIIGVDFIKF